jgi:hypothetical protein
MRDFFCCLRCFRSRVPPQGLFSLIKERVFTYEQGIPLDNFQRKKLSNSAKDDGNELLPIRDLARTMARLGTRFR